MGDFKGLQDCIGQMPTLKTYLHWLQGFPAPENSSMDEIEQELRKAAVKLTAAFPFLAGQVMNEGKGPNNSGLFRIAPCKEFKGTFIRRIRDLRDSYNTFEEISQRQYALQALPGEPLAPRTAFPLSYEDEDGPAPVLAVQVNFVKGGILIDWSCQHNTMDASGCTHTMRLFAAVLRGEGVPASWIDPSSLDRGSLIPLLGPDEPLEDHSFLMRPEGAPGLPVSVHGFPPSPFQWYEFRFSAASLAALKKAALCQEEFVPGVANVTIDDILSAFCWQRVSTVRHHRGVAPADAVSKIGRAVDVRGLVGLDSKYLGHMIYISPSWLSLEDLATKSLAHVSSVIRASLNGVYNERTVRSFATLLDRTDDKMKIGFGGHFDPTIDMGCSSCIALPWHFDCGSLLGWPSFTKRPLFTALPSTVYVMPLLEDGSIEVQICLQKEDVQGLRCDEKWSRHTTELL